MGTQEVFTVVIPVVSVIGAVLAALFAGSQARYTHGQLRLAEQVRKDQAQPYVFVDLRPDEQDPQKVMLVVQNTGVTVARNVRITFDPPLRSMAVPDIGQLEIFRTPISTLPPGRKLQWFFDIGFRIFEQADAVRRYIVKINADGPFGPVEELSYEIDLDDLGRTDAAAPMQKRIADDLHKARVALEKMAATPQQTAARPRPRADEASAD